MTYHPTFFTIQIQFAVMLTEKFGNQIMQPQSSIAEFYRFYGIGSESF